jgi:GNAT superfamily N-acetyltransferase
VRIVDYDPSRRADVADLTARVWGERPDESQLKWFFERNPVRPASVLLAEEDGRVVGTVAISFQRMSVGGEELEVGMPVRLATDPAYRGRGIFAQLEEANEQRARDLGLRLLLIVPNAASAPILLARLGWKKLPSPRVWARTRLWPSASRARRVDRFDSQLPVSPTSGARDRVLRDAAWLNWRFADSQTPYALLAGDGYAVVRRRGRLGVVAAVEGDLLRDANAAAGGVAVVAAPPHWQRGRYARAGYIPTTRTFMVLGKPLHPRQALPVRPHLELGDLDFL